MSRRLNFHGRQLLRELRRLRQEAGLTQGAAGEHLRFGKNKMNRIESENQIPGWHELRAMLDLYGVAVNNWEPYLELWEVGQERGWWDEYDLDDYSYIAHEVEATHVRQFCLGYVPGLLQTAAYTRAVFANSWILRREKRIEDDIEVRLRRQERLRSAVPLELHAVVNEPILRQKIAPEIMRDQLNRLIETAVLDNVVLQVLPESAGLNDGQNGSFLILNVPDERYPEMLYAEHAFATVPVRGVAEVALAKLRLDGLAKLALPPDDSLDLIEDLAADL
ncbi:helix-turn-helix protein [Herbihabitans rhizosphaerae]|uniref:Helix-turn-helix protein n=1 Tax=Herbihabitans rhizosphaerae TaxID=1872711 RepID=A0A4Q7KC17_9PSEU|nr:helix-turn-helix transcriptional regulator [Herbihabitans rhizosphaerae]RZS30527.1 helix-turn-helix protein [Herbihabitans rhizosphaerae]